MFCGGCGSEGFPRERYASLEEWPAPDQWLNHLDLDDVAPPSRHGLGEPDPTRRGPRSTTSFATV